MNTLISSLSDDIIPLILNNIQGNLVNAGTGTRFIFVNMRIMNLHFGLQKLK